MSAVNDRLIKAHDKIVLLFTPPFNQTKPNPGYIHQATYPVFAKMADSTRMRRFGHSLAYAALGDGDKAGQLFSMLNPISHGSTRADIQRYKVEPYVAAGDIYAEAPHTGRGGWTWYTGSAGWLYRAGIEWILGCRLRGTTIFIDPCIPKNWPGFELSFRYHSARYELKVENPNGVSKGILVAEVDGKPVRGGAAIALVDDGATHHIKIILGT